MSINFQARYFVIHLLSVPFFLGSIGHGFPQRALNMSFLSPAAYSDHSCNQNLEGSNISIMLL